MYSTASYYFIFKIEKIKKVKMNLKIVVKQEIIISGANLMINWGIFRGIGGRTMNRE